MNFYPPKAHLKSQLNKLFLYISFFGKLNDYYALELNQNEMFGKLLNVMCMIFILKEDLKFELHT